MAFKEWTMPTNLRGERGMNKNQVSVLYREKDLECNKSTAYTMTLNVDLTKSAFEKGMTKISFSTDDITGEVAFILRRDKGLQMQVNGKKGQQRVNLTVASKFAIGKLYDELGLQKGNYYKLDISDNKSVRDDVMFFVIKKPQL